MTQYRGKFQPCDLPFFVSHRMYCKDLKPPDKNKNNTEFLMEFNDYIDTKTPNHPMCEY